MLAVFPLLGAALQSSERVSIFLRARTTSGNPVETLRAVVRLTGNYLDSGSFRPVGRFAEFLGHGVAFEAAEATALAPHEILGLVRLAMVALVALLAVRIVGAMGRSASIQSEGSLLAFYPLALGVVTVAGGTGATLWSFPHVRIGAVALILGAALTTARDHDLQRRRVRWHEYLVMAAWGAAAAAFSDLAYAAPAVALGFIAARAVAGRLGAAATLASAAMRRWVGLAVGFAVVFVPARVAIARRCGAVGCDAASDVGFPPGFGASFARFVSGLPMQGWRASAKSAGAAGFDLGFADMRANLPLMAAMLAALGLAAVFFARGRAPALRSAEPADAGAAGASGRLAVALVGLGVLTAAVSALIAGSTAWAQSLPIDRALRVGWRETLLTQIGWSFVIAGCLAALDVAARHRLARRAARLLARRGLGVADEQAGEAQLTVAVRAAVALVLAFGLMLTVRANWQVAQIDRFDSASTAVSLIGASVVNLDDTDAGNEIRCSLIDSYTEAASATGWTSGENLREKLDQLMLERHGWPHVYCDPERLSDADR